MPRRAPRPTPTMIAAGTARPSAHGQAMIRTLHVARAVIPNVFAVVHAARCSSVATHAGSKCGANVPMMSQPSAVTRAIASTLGTKIALMRSASFCTGGLLACAFSTSLMMPASADSLPAAVTRTTRLPSRLSVPPITASPVDLRTGSGSPVSMDSSTPPAPLSTTPSAGTAVPGRTNTRSSVFSSLAGTSVGSCESLWPATPSEMPLRFGGSRSAVGGERSSSARIASPALSRAAPSSQWPKLISVNSPAASMK